MNKTVGFQLVGYSLLLGALSYLVHYLAPPLARATLIAGLGGSVLCLVWGVRSALGYGGKALPVMTLIPVTFVLLSQAVVSWSATGEAVPGRPAAAAVTTLIFLMSLGMLMRIAYAGVVFDGEAVGPTRPLGSTMPLGGKSVVRGDARKGA